MTSAPSAAGSTKHAVVKIAMLVREPRVVATTRRQVADFSKIQDCACTEKRVRVSGVCCVPPACCAAGSRSRKPGALGSERQQGCTAARRGARSGTARERACTHHGVMRAQRKAPCASCPHGVPAVRKANTQTRHRDIVGALSARGTSRSTARSSSNARAGCGGTAGGEYERQAARREEGHHLELTPHQSSLQRPCP